MADLPTAAIVCIALSLYVAVIIGLVLLCYCLKGRGRCSGQSNCCAKKEGQSCECCIAMSEACNCCQSPSLKSCLNSCCPKKHITCVDLIMCQCCASDGTTLCDLKCCMPCRRDNPETCNCLCLEIRLRSSKDLNLPQPTAATSSTAAGGKVKPAWMSDRHLLFHGIPTLPDPAGPDGFRIAGYHHNHIGGGGSSDHLGLDLGSFRNSGTAAAAYPVSAHPFNTSRSDHSGDFVPTSTPRFHQGRSQLFVQPGVHSAGRLIAKRQSGHWGGVAGTGRRLSMRRRSSRRVRIPLALQQEQPLQQLQQLQQQQHQQQHQQQQRLSLQRRRSSRVNASVMRPVSRRHSHREPVAQLPYEEDSLQAYDKVQ